MIAGRLSSNPLASYISEYRTLKAPIDKIPKPRDNRTNVPCEYAGGFMFEGGIAPLYPSQKDLISKFESWLQLEVAHGDPSLNTLVSYLGSTRTFLRWCSSFGVDEGLAGPDDIKHYRASLVSF